MYFVADAPGGAEVRLLLDGKPVPAKMIGRDAPGGIVRTGRSDLYWLLALPAPATHRLTLVAQRGFRLYTFTFG